MEQHKGFSVIETIENRPHLAQAEFSLLLDNAYKEIIPEKYYHNSRYFFNRLIVPKPIRGRGIATNLLTQATTWADTERVVIINFVNAYPDSDLTEEQTIKLYKKFGFLQILDTQLMIRYPNDCIPVYL
jgi:GNAT superfamily N-acetyltransferase